MPPELPYQRRDEFDQELYLRPFSTDCRRFMQLMYCAANGTPAAGIEGQFKLQPEPVYVLVSDGGQQAIAAQCGFRNDTAVRRVCSDLENYGILRRITQSLPNGGRETYYYLSLSRLIAIPRVDPETPIGRAMQALAESNPFSEEFQQLPVGSPVGSPVVMNHDHDHERLNEFNNSINHDHEATHDYEPDVRRFGEMSAVDIAAIAGYPVTLNGKQSYASIPSRRRLLEEYFRDAVTAGFACEADLPQFAAVIHAAARLNRKPEADKLRVGDPGKWVYRCWANRKKRPIGRIDADDRRRAADLLRVSDTKAAVAERDQPAKADAIAAVDSTPCTRSLIKSAVDLLPANSKFAEGLRLRQAAASPDD